MISGGVENVTGAAATDVIKKLSEQVRFLEHANYHLSAEGRVKDVLISSLANTIISYQQMLQQKDLT